ncbi:gamma-tubulin complex component 5 isoform X5 [Macaca thibetana thibetana]|uniref:gamma-tubulin complex component 5 isoform X5 n=1 Tax=Macaca thibetana thibetana TaxID=257877 RepID=UPI0021BC4B9A|nr:gamma-tubulin complex component 5 isoform X5 [Macaca thibetana thibetana]
MARHGPPLSWLDAQQERDVRELVRGVAGLPDEADPNFQLALNFAWSNFRFHRFLDVNSHKIEKTIEGIYEKFIIHSDLSKAASWKRLTEEFLNAPLPSIKEIKTDAHYSILSLLLCLSDSPSNSNYVETPRDKEVEKKDDFDWGKYLMEGEEMDIGPYMDTPNWSEESEEENDQLPLSREDSGIQIDRTPLEEQDQNRKLDPCISWKADEPDDRSWLEHHVVHQYWTARPSQFPHSLHLHSNLAAVWDQHLYSSDPLYVPDDRVLVTETQVIRETLWLLSGVKKLFIFQLIDGKVTVRNNIIVTHLTHSCLRSVLEQIAAYGQVVFRLQQFIDEVMGHSSESMLPGSGSVPKKSTEAPFRTYQAFMWALYKYFISFKEELAEIEKCIINNDATITLAIVVDKLAPRLAQLKVLHKVFSTGVAEVPPDTRNVVRASHLLNTLYKAILEYDDVGEASEQTVSLLFSLWVETVRPYLQTVDEWIVHGHLWDGAREFIIQRNKNVPVNHRDFWYATYTLYSVSEKTENEEKMSDNASASSGSDQGPSSRQHTMVSFLKPVLKQIIMAGKSMQLLKNLQCAESTTCQAGARDAERKSLYTLFLESVQSRLRHGEDSTPQVLTEQQATKENLMKMQSIAERHLELDDVHDPLLAINFASLSISFENVDTAKKKLPVHILDGLTLSYKVPWPVDIVISLECQKIYNQVFLLLLQIKWAKYSLDVLLFGELVSTAEKPRLQEGLVREQDTVTQFGPQKEPVRQQIHRMFLLRVKLMHFVNSLHNYIMTRILHSTGLEFQHQVEEAKDLDQLIKIHYRYLSTIHDRCLLREKVSFVKEAIMKVLNLALMFADGWQAGLGTWRMESIEKMESDFKNCHMFLVTILNKAVCRGSFPHLESLALSLMAGMEQS